MTQLLRNTSIPEAPCSNLNFLLKVAVALEKAAQSDEYFVKRKLYPNVDFYTGFICTYWGVAATLFAIERIDCKHSCRQTVSSFCFKCHQVSFA
ncbi:citrate synthase 1, peroxisomal-like isoform X2 [Rosa chinensis]|uniref:citrate synthase 1, peroxisomal-like isoform X2 n=1 Tax=Rosa chinensis TaxID=74649 RepID=UPI001AD94951|nr:citrate synthase 1, peroxisomal-like isoform X2 [Rosa chinensis]